MSSLDSTAPPEIALALTGRSSCQSCKRPIDKGDQRVGMVGRSSGVSVRKWLHPQCFALGLHIDYAPTGRAKCRGDGSEIAKGEPRLLMRLLRRCGEEQQVAVQQIYKPENTVELLKNYLSLPGVTVTYSSIGGLTEMPSAHQKWIVDTLRGRNVSALPKPAAAPPQSERIAKAITSIVKNDATRESAKEAKKEKQSTQAKLLKHEKAKEAIEKGRQEKVKLKEAANDMSKCDNDATAFAAARPPKVFARAAEDKAAGRSAKGRPCAHIESQQHATGHKRSRPAPELAARAALLAAQVAEESPEEID